MVIENQYIQTSLMVALTLFKGKEGGGPPLFINQRWTLYKHINIWNYIYTHKYTHIYIYILYAYIYIQIYTHTYIYIYIYFFPAAQEKVIRSSRYIKFSGVVLNLSWTGARLGPSIKTQTQGNVKQGKSNQEHQNDTQSWWNRMG